jgi:hypothetical protein
VGALTKVNIFMNCSGIFRLFKQEFYARRRILTNCGTPKVVGLGG